jgi:hypothetical protein
MAKKKPARRKTRKAKHSTSRRKRRLGAGGLGGLVANPIVAGITGGLAAGAACAFLSKPGKDGKPMVEDSFKRLLFVAGGFYAAGKFLKVPAPIVNGALVTVGVIAGMQKLNPKDKAPIFSFADDGEIEYVSPGLLNDAATLADAYAGYDSLNDAATLAETIDLADGEYVYIP